MYVPSCEDVWCQSQNNSKFPLRPFSYMNKSNTYDSSAIIATGCYLILYSHHPLIYSMQWRTCSSVMCFLQHPSLRCPLCPSGNSESESKLWELINRSYIDIMGLATAYRGGKGYTRLTFMVDCWMWVVSSLFVCTTARLVLCTTEVHPIRI